MMRVVTVTETRIRRIEMDLPVSESSLQALEDLKVQAIEDPNFFNHPGCEGSVTVYVGNKS